MFCPRAQTLTYDVRAERKRYIPGSAGGPLKLQALWRSTGQAYRALRDQQCHAAKPAESGAETP
jgi:hypothetical protein